MKHEIDSNGEKIHIDADQVIPTGVCIVCIESKALTDSKEE